MTSGKGLCVYVCVSVWSVCVCVCVCACVFVSKNILSYLQISVHSVHLSLGISFLKQKSIVNTYTHVSEYFLVLESTKGMRNMLVAQPYVKPREISFVVTVLCCGNRTIRKNF